jgi:hypothetical protein
MIEALCATWLPDEQRFGPAGTRFPHHAGLSDGGGDDRATCPIGYVVDHIRISPTVDGDENPRYVAHVALICRTVRPPDDVQTVEFGRRPSSVIGVGVLTGGNPRLSVVVDCRGGDVATGLIGRAGYYVDALGLLCGPPPRIPIPPSPPSRRERVIEGQAETPEYTEPRTDIQGQHKSPLPRGAAPKQ